MFDTEITCYRCLDAIAKIEKEEALEEELHPSPGVHDICPLCENGELFYDGCPYDPGTINVIECHYFIPLNKHFYLDK